MYIHLYFLYLSYYFKSPITICDIQLLVHDEGILHSSLNLEKVLVRVCSRVPCSLARCLPV